MSADFGGKPWSWIHHMSVVTAAAANPGARILFWYEHEPSGPWWEASRAYLTPRKITAPTEIYGRPLVHPAHRADVVRLLVLLEHGGVYLDADVWCLRPFAEIDHAGFWMGRQGDAYGLCNATMGGDARACFAAEWLTNYRSFRSTGHDAYWDEHSVCLPLALAAEIPEAITILPADRLFAPLWGQLRRIFQPARGRQAVEYLANSYSVHLWESICWGWLSRLTHERIDRSSEIGRRLVELGVL